MRKAALLGGSNRLLEQLPAGVRPAHGAAELAAADWELLERLAEKLTQKKEESS